MGNRSTSERAAAEQERRRRFQDAVPEHFCRNCTALVYEAEEACFECDTVAPSAGWTQLRNSGDAWLGRVISERYLITRHLKTGTASRIYVADSRVIPRSFAVKIMDVSQGPDLDKDEFRRRLKREVEAIGTLRNPHIVSFYDVVELGDRHVALVMDLIEGYSLAELIEESGAFGIARSVEILRQLGNGIFEAHSRQLVHRDLKPSNVMIEALPAGDDFARILDFGVMWIRGTVAGTGALDAAPIYASPEQIENREIDERSDLYSLGALFFYMLTGKPPFSEDIALGNLDMLLASAPPTLEETTGRVFPAAAEALVAKLLEKDPDRRPRDIGAMLERLSEISLSEPSEPFEVAEASQASDRSVPVSVDTSPPASPNATSMGMFPTRRTPTAEFSAVEDEDDDIGASPRILLEASEMSDVSEVEVDDDTGVMACRGEGYAFVRGEELVWAGTFFGHAKLDTSLDYTALAVSRALAILGTADGRILSVAPGGSPRELFQDPRQAPISSVALTSDGGTRIAGSKSGRLYVGRGDEFVRMGTGDDAVGAIALSEDGSQFAIARGTGIQIMHANASNLSSFPSPVSEVVTSLAFSPDSYLVAVLTEEGTVVLESVHTGQEMMRLDTGNEALAAVSFSSDNHLMGLFRDGARVVLRQLT